MATTPPKAYASVWDAIEDTPQAAAHMRARSTLMMAIAHLVRAHDWTQADTAKHCAISQPRVSDLLRGRVSKFSLDALVDIATALGYRVDIRLVKGRASRGPAPVKASGK